jgi:hypothetical protein
VFPCILLNPPAPKVGSLGVRSAHGRPRRLCQPPTDSKFQGEKVEAKCVYGTPHPPANARVPWACGGCCRAAEEGGPPPRLPTWPSPHFHAPSAPHPLTPRKAWTAGDALWCRYGCRSDTTTSTRLNRR